MSAALDLKGRVDPLSSLTCFLTSVLLFNPFPRPCCTVPCLEQSPVDIHQWRTLCCYSPQRSCGKVMFIHVSVILLTGRLWQTDTPLAGRHPEAGRHPPAGRHPLAGRQLPPDNPPATPLPGRHPPGTATAADGTHPIGMHSCYLYFTADGINRYYYPILVPIGIAGNVLSFLVSYIYTVKGEPLDSLLAMITHLVVQSSTRILLTMLFCS